MSSAVDKTRRGGGPMLLEYTTYRWHAHVGLEKDFAEAYRYPKEEALACKNDSIKKMAADLRKRWGVRQADLDAVSKDIEKEVDEAVEFAERSPFPAADRLHADVFKEAAAA